MSNDNSPTAIEHIVPFRVVLAQRVTGGNYPEYVNRVRKDKPVWRTPNGYEIFESPLVFDSPLVQADSLAREMVFILPSAPDNSSGISAATPYGSPAALPSVAMFTGICSQQLLEDFGRWLSKVPGWSADEWRTEHRAAASALADYEKQAKNLQSQLAAETSEGKKAAEIREKITNIEACLLQLQQGKERIEEEMRLAEEAEKAGPGRQSQQRQAPPKIFLLSEFKNFLKSRFDEALTAILKERMNDRMRIWVALVGRDGEGAIEELPRFAVTETMFLGDDGLLHQSSNSTRVWRVIGVESLTPKADVAHRAKGAKGAKGKVGRPPVERDAAEARMKEDITTGRITVDSLSEMKQEALAKTYGVNREAAVNARRNVLSTCRKLSETN